MKIGRSPRVAAYVQKQCDIDSDRKVFSAEQCFESFMAESAIPSLHRIQQMRYKECLRPEEVAPVFSIYATVVSSRQSLTEQGVYVRIQKYIDRVVSFFPPSDGGRFRRYKTTLGAPVDGNSGICALPRRPHNHNLGIDAIINLSGDNEDVCSSN
jgi:hypothetical protein